KDGDPYPSLLHPEIVEAIRGSVDAGEFDEWRPKVVRHDLQKLLDAGEQPMVRAITGHPIVGKLIGVGRNGRRRLVLGGVRRPGIATTEARQVELVTAD